jgi:hypothetical protein
MANYFSFAYFLTLSTLNTKKKLQIIGIHETTQKSYNYHSGHQNSKVFNTGH